MGRARWLLFGALVLLAVAVYQVSAVGCPMGQSGCVGTAEPIDVGGIVDIPGAIVGALFGLFGAIVDALMGLVAHVIGLLPDMPDLGIPSLSGWLVGYAFFDTYLPLHEALTGMGLVLSLVIASYTWRLGVEVYHLILKPGVGT